MIRTRLQMVWSLTLAAALASPVFAAAPDSDETRLQTEQQGIEKDKSVKTDTEKTDQLAKQFNVPNASVQDLRTKGQGWGEITIGLAEADKLAQMDPKTYPTTADALTKVETLRASG